MVEISPKQNFEAKVGMTCWNSKKAPKFEARLIYLSKKIVVSTKTKINPKNKSRQPTLCYVLKQKRTPSSRLAWYLHAGIC